MKVIGLTGLARAGKDTTCGFILDWCEANGLRAERLAFADPLKVSVARALGFDGTVAECVETCDEIKHNGEIRVEFGTANPPYQITITGREFLQRYGTEAHRDVFGLNFWVDVTENRLNALDGAVDVVVLTDCRFPNEANMVHRHADGEVWEIVRPGAGLDDGLEAHTSEAGVGDARVDCVVLNDGAFDTLGHRVRRILGHRVRRICEDRLL